MGEGERGKKRQRQRDWIDIVNYFRSREKDKIVKRLFDYVLCLLAHT